MEQQHAGKIQSINTIVCTERRAIRPNRVENTFAARQPRTEHVFIMCRTCLSCAEHVCHVHNMFSIHQNMFSIHQSMFKRHQNMFSRHQSMFSTHQSMFSIHQNMFKRHQNMLSIHQNMRAQRHLRPLEVSLH